jgi:DDE superfamily endonuclease
MELYGGSKSDEDFVQDCGLFNCLNASDMQIVDKGFKSRPILPSSSTLNISSFPFNGQFMQENIITNRNLASAWNNVERAVLKD